MGKWVFEELRGAAVRRDPKETELFKTEQTEEGEYAGTDALVREVLQNSIDAGGGEGPVRVRIAIHEASEAPVGARLAHYFQRLRQPLAARQVPFSASGVPQLPCRFLVCEDFGTRGLEGDTLLFSDPPPNDKSRQYFYWFWRNIGRSGKTGDDLGRWGLGKTVYRAASRVGCMFGLTVRESDRRQLLMGQAVLQIHRHGGKEYMPEGYWCGEQNVDGLPLPIDDSEQLERFREEWRITRTTEPGLSVVAPYVREELKAIRLLQAVAVHFFTRIVRGELVVEIVHPDFGSITLDEQGIEQACKKILWDGPKRTKRHVAPPVTFARTCVRKPPATHTQVLGRERVPELTEAAFVGSEVSDLRHHFSAGELTSVRVKFWLPRLVGAGEEGYLDVYLQRTSEGERFDSYYVREGMTITKINSQAGRRGIRSLVVVDRGALAELLGDTEGPAHEDWDTSAERPERIWARGWKGRVKFVRGVVDRLAELLTPPVEEPDFDLLSDFFSIPQGQQRQPLPGTDAKRPAVMAPIEAAPKWFRITERSGGFTIGRTSSVPLPVNATLRLSVAYDIPRGNPLTNWSQYDFQISSSDAGLRPKGNGIKAERLNGNTVLLKVLDHNFTFSIDGFDQHRDLFVRVDDVSTGEEETS